MCYKKHLRQFLLKEKNILKDRGNEQYSEGTKVEWHFYEKLCYCFKAYDRMSMPDTDPYDSFGYSVDRYLEKARYIFGITDINPKIAIIDEEIGEIGFHGRGWWWYYTELVSEEYTEKHGTVIINFYGDTGYLFVDKTMKYNLEFGEKGVKIASVECLYSNDDLFLARGSI